MEGSSLEHVGFPYETKVFESSGMPSAQGLTSQVSKAFLCEWEFPAGFDRNGSLQFKNTFAALGKMPGLGGNHSQTAEHRQ